MWIFSESEEAIDIQKTINELYKLEKEKQEIDTRVSEYLKELGFKI